MGLTQLALFFNIILIVMNKLINGSRDLYPISPADRIL
jgi:hypothetical protein